jgi:hypothetical protein
MNKSNAKYLKGINFLQWTVTEKTEIKALGRAVADLVISRS